MTDAGLGKAHIALEQKEIIKSLTQNNNNYNINKIINNDHLLQLLTETEDTWLVFYFHNCNENRIDKLLPSKLLLSLSSTLNYVNVGYIINCNNRDSNRISTIKIKLYKGLSNNNQFILDKVGIDYNDNDFSEHLTFEEINSFLEKEISENSYL